MPRRLEHWRNNDYMLFSGITFIYYFLPIVLVVYYIIPFKLKNGWLLIASLFFYFWGEPSYTALMLFTIASNYALCLLVGKNRNNPAGRRYLIVSAALCLALLGFFKYADFLISVFNAATGLTIPHLRIPLPLGISFYTFQTMSYTIDVYRGETQAQKNPLTLAAYVSLFPQLVAGPIVRYKTVAGELTSRRHTLSDFSHGAARFVIGLSKKVLLANNLGLLRDMAMSPAENSVILAWLGVIAFSLQVYFDFSGYSDMAIGMGRMLGFHFMENFDYPFISKSISEFWRRWHISLGTWFREYLYIPLGGSRCGKPRWVINLFIVWFCTGLWHGASFNFIIWGLYFGVLLGFEKLVFHKFLKRLPAALRIGYTLLAVIVSFVIFHNDTMTQAVSQFSGMFGISKLPLLGAQTVYLLRSFAVLLSVSALGSTPLVKICAGRLRDKIPAVFTIAEPIVIALLLIACTAYLADSSYNPFLYFRF